MTADAGEDVEKKEHFFIAGGTARWLNHSGISLEVPQKIGHSTTRRSSYSTSVHIPQRHSNIQQRHMHHNVRSSSIYNIQKLERTQMSFSRWMDTKIVIHLHNGVLLSHQKQWLKEILKKMDASREYHPEWDNTVTKEQTKYAVTDNLILTSESTENLRNNLQNIWSSRNIKAPKMKNHYA